MAIEIVAVGPPWQKALAEFFASIRLSSEHFFHPHPLTDEYAEELVRYAGRDLYYLLTEETRVLAYGMLRGWDEGYEVPSLGLAVHPEARGCKFGEVMMHFLHAAARRKGARCVRLKVYGENAPARGLYAKLGYVFTQSDGQLVGVISL